MHKRVDWLKTPGAPMQVGFMASLLLSLLAVLGNPVPNRDGMLYVTTARAILEKGLVARADFDWPFYPLLIAGFGRVAGIDLEWVAYGINALFLAGACALMIDLVRRRAPESSWAACLVVLAIPGYNGYRDFIIREFGYWFFCTLAFWLASRWEDANHRWREVVAAQVALACAVLFRLEAAVFFPALLMWQATSAPPGARILQCFKIAVLPLLAGLILVALFASGTVVLPQRAAFYLSAANFFEIREGFRHASDGLGIYLPALSRNDAGFILNAGLLALIFVKFVKMLGIFAIPLGYAVTAVSARSLFRRWLYMPWAFIFYLLALAAFATHQLFVSARYVTTLGFLVVPMVAAGYSGLKVRYPGVSKAIVVVALVTMAANVISTSPGKGHLRVAGKWLANNVENPNRVYIQDQSVAYLAGWPYRHGMPDKFDEAQLAEAVLNHKFEVFVLMQSRRESYADDWLKKNRLSATHKFANRAGDAVLVVDLRP